MIVKPDPINVCNVRLIIVNIVPHLILNIAQLVIPDSSSIIITEVDAKLVIQVVKIVMLTVLAQEVQNHVQVHADNANQDIPDTKI